MTTSSSKQNLDSIVEAIRHLEGDHLFTTPESGTMTVSSSGEEAGPQQVYIFTEMAEPVPGTGSKVLNLEPVPKLEPWFCIFGTMVPQQYECGLHP